MPTAIGTQRQTIRKVVSFLNNKDADGGGFWLPNIQRPFVWTEEQICRLFDSILRQYPISTLLVWRTNSKIRRRKFIDNWRSSLRLNDFYVPEDNSKKCLVLDGQQRLRSFYIALEGSYEGREPCFDILSGDQAVPEDIKYKFAFRTDSGFPWIKFKELVKSNALTNQLSNEIQSRAGRTLSNGEKEKVANHLGPIALTCKIEEVVTYQELDSIDNEELYGDDDVVEVFIRANSGGTRLGKSELLFSLLTVSWETADEAMEDFLTSLNQQGFRFTRDFVLKTCLVLLGHGARYEVKKFREAGVREEIENTWDHISDAIRAVLDFIRDKTFIQSDKALPTYLVLIPLIYLRYKFPDAWKTARNQDDMGKYVLRCSLSGAFGGSSDDLLDDLTAKLDELKRFDLEEIFGVIRNRNKSLRFTEERLWRMGYGSDSTHLLFSLWYPRFEYTPFYDKHLPQVDHIFPQSLLRKVRVLNPKTGHKDRIRYHESERNQLANCMLLTKEENELGGKGEKPPNVWFQEVAKKKDLKQYLEMHLIPKDPALWQLDRFDDFIEARKSLIRDKFADFLD